MAKGGNNKRSNSLRFSKPYDVSNSFVTKVASRVSDYFGGWFGTPKTSESSLLKGSENKVCRPVYQNLEVKESSTSSNDFFTMENSDTTSAKRLKICEKEKVDIDFPISPIPSTSGILQYNINNNYGISKNENFMRSATNPISLSNEAFLQTNVSSHPTSSATIDVKSNGTIDNHSDSSESTSGCSSLVPQSDRLSQSAFQCTNSRKRNLEDKLKYARQLQQSRAAMFLNRSIPNNFLNAKKKPSFDVTAYKTVTMEKALLREKFNNSPFYTGQTSYGGASAYKSSKNSFCTHKTSKSREPVQVQVKPSKGSTEDLTNMSHTAKKILEALEQFSTPINDAKRIPVSKLSSIGLKRQRLNDLSETKLRLSKPFSPLNPSPGPVIAVLNVPTVPDLLKLKRLERIQNSTAAARQVASQKQEYTLPCDSKVPVKRTGKMVMKLKNKEKDILLEKPEKVSLPAIPLPITTLPKFDFKLPSSVESLTNKTGEPKLKSRQFKFSAPIPVSVVSGNITQQILKSDFTFSNPLDTTTKSNVCKDTCNSLQNVFTCDASSQLKCKSINDCSLKSNTLKAANESAQDKVESVSGFFSENVKLNTNETSNLTYTWECNNCFIRNVNDIKICCGCKCERILDDRVKNSSNPRLLEEQSQEATCSPDFGDKFKPPSGSWDCKECYVNNKEFASKCVACETPKPSATPSKEVSPQKVSKSVSPANGFGDKFRRQANQWECSVCMLLNMESATKCVACETPKPGKKAENTESKFSFCTKPTKECFAFGIDKTDAENVGIKSVADSSTFKNHSNSSNSEILKNPNPQFNTITTSVGVFTFGIPPTIAETTKEQPSKSKDSVTSNSRFQVTSTSGLGARQEEFSSIIKNTAGDEKEKIPNIENTSVTSKNLFTTINDSPKSVGVEAFTKPSSDVFLKNAVEENKLIDPENKDGKLFFGLSSEAVSSSTVDSTFAQKKSETSALTLGQSNVTTLQFNTLGASESSALKPSSNMSLEINKPEVKLLNPASATATNLPPIFSSISSSNEYTSKLTFPIAATSNNSLNVREGNLTTSSTYLSAEQQPFPSNFNSRDSMKETLTNSFDITTQQNEKSITGNCSSFGTGIFTNIANPFSSSLSSSNQLTSKPLFGGIEQNQLLHPAISNFSSNPTSTFGEPTFIPSSNEINKASQPFIFGASVSSVTSTSTSSPHVFTFGASKQEMKPSVFTFGQSGGPNCTFESNAQTTNLFGNMSQLKTNASIGLPFGSSTVSTFGQSTAPASFESNTPKFEFGTSSTQQQITPGLFQFSAASAPTSAPPGTNFSLSVPQKFNFSAGLPSVLSSESQSAIRPARKVIRAVRRTNPRRTN